MNEAPGNTVHAQGVSIREDLEGEAVQWAQRLSFQQVIGLGQPFDGSVSAALLLFHQWFLTRKGRRDVSANQLGDPGGRRGVRTDCRRAGGGEEFSPPNAELDRDLDRALEEEYSEPVDPPSMAQPRAPDYARQVQKEERRSSRIGVRLRMMSAYAYSFLSDVKISKRHDGLGGDEASFADSGDGSDANRFDFEGSGGGVHDVGLHLGKYVVLRLGARHASFEETQQLSATAGGTPGSTSPGPASRPAPS